MNKTLAILAAILAAGAAHAGETYVFINNHTGTELTVQTETRLSRKHWKQSATRVPAGRRVEVLRFSRTSGITSGEEFVFRTTVSAGASKYVIAQCARGNWYDSHLWQAVQGDAWSDDRNEHRSSWTQDDGRVIPVKYKAVGAGAGYDDVAYRFDAPVALPKASGPLKVLAYNTWLLPAGSEGRAERAALMAAQLSGYDVLMLSEAFDDEERRNLIHALRKEYPFYTGVVGEDFLVEQDGGVLMMAKWPLVNQTQILFNFSKGWDSFAHKGAMYAKLEHPGGPVHLVATHTQSEDEVTIRATQFVQIRKLVDSLKIPADQPVLVGGDLNVDKLGKNGEWGRMLQILGAGAPEHSGSPYTWNPDENPLADGKREALDHVLYLVDHRLPRAASSQVAKPRARWSGGEDLSDHFAIAAFYDFDGAAAAPALRAAAPVPQGDGTLLGMGGN